MYKKIASLQIVIDKIHMVGHVDKRCMKNHDPRNIAELNDVSTWSPYPLLLRTNVAHNLPEWDVSFYLLG